MTPYAIADTDLILDVEPYSSEKKYILKIRDLPQEDKPREKLLALGPSVLSNQELLAVVLGTGTKKEGVLEMSSRVLKEYGERVLSRQTNAPQMAQELSIPLIKAIQIVACAELGKRFFQENPSSAPTIRTARDVFEYLHDMRSLPREHMRGIYLNIHHKVIHDEVISIGTVNSSLIHPREVFKPGIEYNAAAVILAHNHPSGVVSPSQADIDITKQLVSAGKIIGIHLIDHVIVTPGSFASIDVDYN
jgi:DNA repair protein RadC